MPTFGILHNGRMRVPIVNHTDEDVILPKKNVLGFVSHASPAVNLTVLDSLDPSNSPPRCNLVQTSSVEAELDRFLEDTELSVGEMARLRELLRKYHGVLE